MKIARIDDAPPIVLARPDKAGFGGFFAKAVRAVADPEETDGIAPAMPMFQTPELVSAGVMQWTPAPGTPGAPKEYIRVFCGHRMRDFLESYDASIREECIKNWTAWFGGEAGPQVVQSFTPATFSRNEDDAPVFRFPVGSGRNAVSIFDAAGAACDYASTGVAQCVPHGSILTLLMALEGVWFSKGKWGGRYKVTQVKIQSS